MKKTIIALAYILIASFSSPIIAAGDAEAGQAKTATCMGCHGLAGNSTIPTSVSYTHLTLPTTPYV